MRPNAHKWMYINTNWITPCHPPDAPGVRPYIFLTTCFWWRELSEKKGGFYTTPSNTSIICISNQLNRFLHIHINEATKSDCLYINVRVHYYYNTFISLRQWHFVKSSSIIILSKQPSFPRDIPDRDKGKPEIDDSGEVKVYLFIANNQYNPAIRLSIWIINNTLL